MVNKIRRQNKIKEENPNDNTILEDTNKRGRHGREYDIRVDIKSSRLEGKSKSETTAHGRALETARENIYYTRGHRQD